eukprot:258078-Lingulodinium_polyedra.AAC.1
MATAPGPKKASWGQMRPKGRPKGYVLEFARVCAQRKQRCIVSLRGYYASQLHLKHAKHAHGKKAIGHQ